MMTATYDAIATTTLGSSNQQITFSSVPQTYTDLIVVVQGNGSASVPYARFNGDTGTNYSYVMISGFSQANQTPQTVINPNTATPLITGNYLGFGTNESYFKMHIQNYANTTTFKSFISYGTQPNQDGGWCLSMMNWRSTAAITSINISVFSGATFSAGTIFTLFGIKAE